MIPPIGKWPQQARNGVSDQFTARIHRWGLDRRPLMLEVHNGFDRLLQLRGHAAPPTAIFNASGFSDCKVCNIREIKTIQRFFVSLRGDPVLNGQARICAANLSRPRDGVQRRFRGIISYGPKGLHAANSAPRRCKQSSLAAPVAKQLIPMCHDESGMERIRRLTDKNTIEFSCREAPPPKKSDFANRSQFMTENKGASPKNSPANACQKPAKTCRIHVRKANKNESRSQILSLAPSTAHSLQPRDTVSGRGHSHD